LHSSAMRPVTFFALGAGAVALLGLSTPSLAEPPGAGGVTLLELFTSQGCSSCPPADKLLAEYGTKKGVITLSFSVDYWNYLGWHDTLSSPGNSERQRDYALARGDGRVYTPQVVVDGIMHVNGSSEAACKRGRHRGRAHSRADARYSRGSTACRANRDNSNSRPRRRA